MDSWETLELLTESEDHWIVRCIGLSDKVKGHKRNWAVPKRKDIANRDNQTKTDHEIPPEWVILPEPDCIKKLKIRQDIFKSWDDVPELIS